MPPKRRSSPRTTRRRGGSTGHTSCSNVNRPRSFAPWSRYSKSLNQVVSKSLTRPDLTASYFGIHLPRTAPIEKRSRVEGESVDRKIPLRFVARTRRAPTRFLQDSEITDVDACVVSRDARD